MTTLLPANPDYLPAGDYTFRDFAQQFSGRMLAGYLAGVAADKVHVSMEPHSSTHARDVPGNGDNTGGLANPTNPLYLLRGGRHFSGVTVQGTDQGHLYNGLYITGDSPSMLNVAIKSIPGNSSANPGETFAASFNRVTGKASIKNIIVEGGVGPLRSAAGFGINNSTADWSIEHMVTRNLAWSAPIAAWQLRGNLDIHGMVAENCPRALGAERLAANMYLADPVWGAPSSGHDITLTYDGGYSGGVIVLRFSSEAAIARGLGGRAVRVLNNHAAGIRDGVRVELNGVRQNRVTWL